MVGTGGLEPPTPRLSSACSNQLSYAPIKIWDVKFQPVGSNRLFTKLVEPDGIEPTTS